MKQFLHILALGGLLGMSACEIPFDIEQKGVSQIYFQAIANADTFMVQPYYAAAIGEPLNNNAQYQATLEVNGESIPLEAKRNGRFQCRHDFQEGDRVRVTVQTESLPLARGETIVQEKPVVTGLDWKQIRTDQLLVTEVQLTLQHTPQEDEYYAIQILATVNTNYSDGTSSEYTYYEIPGYLLSVADSGKIDLEDFLQIDYGPGKTMQNGNRRPFSLLSRKHFEGPRYTFYLNSFDQSIRDIFQEFRLEETAGEGADEGKEPDKPKVVPTNIKTTYRFYMYRLSPEFYHYAKALYQSNFDFLSNMGLTPANFTYTNVSGGLGFVGAAVAGDAAELVLEKNLSEESVPE